MLSRFGNGGTTPVFVRPHAQPTMPIVLADTKMINLTAAKGNPIQAMDLGLTLQARSPPAWSTTVVS